jgi:hypothetical protein
MYMCASLMVGLHVDVVRQGLSMCFCSGWLRLLKKGWRLLQSVAGWH